MIDNQEDYSKLKPIQLLLKLKNIQANLNKQINLLKIKDIILKDKILYEDLNIEFNYYKSVINSSRVIVKLILEINENNQTNSLQTSIETNDSRLKILIIKMNEVFVILNEWFENDDIIIFNNIYLKWLNSQSTEIYLYMIEMLLSLLKQKSEEECKHYDKLCKEKEHLLLLEKAIVLSLAKSLSVENKI